MHFKSAPPVSLNQTASSNTLIGYVGSTGQSTGNHLHFDVNNMGDMGRTYSQKQSIKGYKSQKILVNRLRS